MSFLKVNRSKSAESWVLSATQNVVFIQCWVLSAEGRQHFECWVLKEDDILSAECWRKTTFWVLSAECHPKWFAYRSEARHLIRLPKRSEAPDPTVTIKSTLNLLASVRNLSRATPSFQKRAFLFDLEIKEQEHNGQNRSKSTINLLASPQIEKSQNWIARSFPLFFWLVSLFCM